MGGTQKYKWSLSTREERESDLELKDPRATRRILTSAMAFSADSTLSNVTKPQLEKNKAPITFRIYKSVDYQGTFKDSPNKCHHFQRLMQRITVTCMMFERVTLQRGTLRIGNKLYRTAYFNKIQWRWLYYLVFSPMTAIFLQLFTKSCLKRFLYLSEEILFSTMCL